MAETQRGTCWSITINNPKDEDIKVQLPAGWKLQGQMERGAEGTEHYQGMLSTPQVRFSAIKKTFPRAHIELAKNRRALEKYVHKPETRVAEVDTIVSNIPTLFDYQHKIAARWDDDEWNLFVNQRRDAMGDLEFSKTSLGDIALEYVDFLVGQDIEAGVCGVEYIAVNPMWRSAWKKFYRQLVSRERTAQIKSQLEVYDASQDVQAFSSPRPQDAQGAQAYGECESCPGSGSSEVHMQT